VTAAAYLEGGRIADARPVVAAGMAAIAARGAQGHSPALLRLRAEISLAERDTAGARPRAEQALAAAREIGAAPEVGHCHRVLSQIVPSSEHAASARRIFDELGMTFWSARV
jgi:hypothetical protein